MKSSHLNQWGANRTVVPSPRTSDRGRSGQTKANRHGHRDHLIGLLIYRHGLRVSEACDLRWDDIDLTKRTVIVRPLKGSTDSSHYLERDELAGLKALQRDYAQRGIKSAYVFVNERGEPMSAFGGKADMKRT